MFVAVFVDETSLIMEHYCYCLDGLVVGGGSSVDVVVQLDLNEILICRRCRR